MSDLWIFAAISAILLMLLLLLRRRSEVATHTGALPPARAVERLFDSRDTGFIASQNAEIRRMFFRERRALAHGWITHTRSSLVRLMRQHWRTVRHLGDISVVRELELGFQFAGTLLLCEILSLFVQFGPYSGQNAACRRVANATARLTAGLQLAFTPGMAVAASRI